MQSHPVHQVVAIAASAGGLTALSELLAALPSDLAAAIAIVMHTAPNQRSFLAEILNRRTTLKVKEAAAIVLIKEGCIFSQLRHPIPTNFGT